MSDSTRPAAQDSDTQSPTFFKRLRAWLSPEDADAESVRDVIEELIEERIEESPNDGGAAIDPNERLLLGNVLKLRAITALDIMVPRPDIVAVEVKTPIPDVMALLMEERHSRLPVYRDTLDDVVGMVHVKDVAVMVGEGNDELSPETPPPTLNDIVRPVMFVSPAVRVLDLLLDMRLKRTHMALVVDEYGGIDGLVTIEDVVEQIVGEIDDERHSDETPLMTDNADGTLEADARVALSDFEGRFGPVFTDDEREATDTLGGLVIRLSGHVPTRGELVKHPSGIEFEVMESDPRRVRHLRLRGLPAPAGK
jgi:magnesium and cobalt transporter